MTEKKTLFLLTKTYPFGPYEQYITTELQYIHHFFDKIIIYPNDYYEADKSYNTTLPPNVEVVNLNHTLPQKAQNSISDYLYLIKVTLEEFLTTDDKKNFFRNFRWNLYHFWTQYQLSKYFIKYLDNHGYNSSNSTFYSYWFHKSAMLLSILKDKKKISHFVSRAHSIELYHHDWAIIDADHKVPSFKMFKLKHAAHILTVSNHGRDYFKRKYPAYSPKVQTLCLGVHEPPASTHSKNESYFHIVTCSKIAENKRIHKLAEALKKIDHKVRWTHFGGGSEADTERVINIVNQFPSQVQAVFPGNTPNSEILHFYRTNKIDLFVNLSIVEGLPVSIMEALSYGIPVLATAVYGTPEAVIENTNGFLMDVNFTVDDLVAKLDYAIKNKQVLEQMRKSSHALYFEKFHAEKNYTRLVREFLTA